jgi:hypothetical protein
VFPESVFGNTQFPKPLVPGVGTGFARWGRPFASFAGGAFPGKELQYLPLVLVKHVLPPKGFCRFYNRGGEARS